MCQFLIVSTKKSIDYNQTFLSVLHWSVLHFPNFPLGLSKDLQKSFWLVPAGGRHHLLCINIMARSVIHLILRHNSRHDQNFDDPDLRPYRERRLKKKYSTF